MDIHEAVVCLANWRAETARLQAAQQAMMKAVTESPEYKRDRGHRAAVGGGVLQEVWRAATRSGICEGVHRILARYDPHV
jgi:hypothetical protein